MPAQCHIIGCTRPVVAKDLCGTHYKRVYRHGDVEAVNRPADWGKRHTHPAYNAWRTLHRVYAREIPQEWEDFWTFVAAVPEKPAGKATATRSEPNVPWSVTNFYWKTPKLSPEQRADHATYMRDYQRAQRAANPDYGRNHDLKRHYGVTLDWYNERHAEQGGVCAICKQPETMVIRGKVLNLAVDHCHDEGHVRGLLCADCNRALGMFKHDPNLLTAAIAYLNPLADLV